MDTQIVDPREFGYYLNSHASIQGTSRPGKFTLLLDQNGMSADELQRLSFWCAEHGISIIVSAEISP